MTRSGVFISYSKKDAKWLNGLRTHLTFLEREYDFNIWEDSKIQTGDNWRVEINNALDNARIGVLLVSANFIASDFITNEELPSLLRAAEKEGAYIFSIIVSHCMFMDIESIAKFQTINPPNKPLIAMSEGELDETYMKVTQEIKRVLSVPIPSKKTADYKKANELLLKSYLRIQVAELLLKHQNGLSITHICQQLTIKKRKYIIDVLNELHDAEVIEKTKTAISTQYLLTVEGKKIVANHKKLY